MSSHRTSMAGSIKDTISSPRPLFNHSPSNVLRSTVTSSSRPIVIALPVTESKAACTNRPSSPKQTRKFFCVPWKRAFTFASFHPFKTKLSSTEFTVRAHADDDDVSSACTVIRPKSEHQYRRSISSIFTVTRSSTALENESDVLFKYGLPPFRWGRVVVAEKGRCVGPLEVFVTTTTRVDYCDVQED
ncbi:hypothetical protein BD410DRAFT_787803 [Rickenella mellea]|uniref:Uncharacterized protein n=1 Tax=Rickenella mellea TaxID=50990 RepID=A0A4Y7Q832_9AGAM|nr:hypothetical protein BD410DRAFT_787803 [Rickenella mellea]